MHSQQQFTCLTDMKRMMAINECHNQTYKKMSEKIWFQAVDSISAMRLIV